jgi:prepilin signal peptidase PulO-like enzyme (type II secretory pathway)
VTSLATALVYGALAFAAILLSEHLCRDCVPFDDGPRPGRPPRMALVAIAACVGYVVGGRHLPVQGLIAALILTTALVACSCSDIACGIVPDSFTLLPLAVILGLSAFARDAVPVLSALAVVIPFALAALLSRGRGMGWGDVKLVALAGAVLGFQTSIFAFSAACLVAAASALVLRRRSEPIALVPYLAGSAALALAVPH